jgi:hypothetical protein
MGDAPVFFKILPGALQHIAQLEGRSLRVTLQPNEHGYGFAIAKDQNRLFKAGIHVVTEPSLDGFERDSLHGSTSSPSMNRRLPTWSRRYFPH